MQTVQSGSPSSLSPDLVRGTAVLFVGDEGGGVAALMEMLLLTLEPADRPQVVALAGGRLLNRLEQAGIPVVRLGKRVPRIIHHPGRGCAWRLLASLLNLGWMLGRACRLRRWIRRTRCPIVHAHEGYSVVVAAMARRLSRFALVCHWHTTTFPPLMSRFRSLLERSVDRVLAISEAVAAVLPEALRSRTTVIHNAIRVDEVAALAGTKAGTLRQRTGAGAAAKLIVCLGTYAEHKGQHLLVEAMKQVAGRRPDARCVMMGRTPSPPTERYLERLRERARELGIGEKCHFLLDVPDAVAMLGDADVVVVPTWGVGEGFGLVAAEAMACGKPVVAFDAGAAREVLSNGVTGFLVADQDVGALARAILAVLEDPRRAGAMGRAGHERVRRLFDAPRFARDILAVYRELGKVESPQPAE